MNFFKYLSEKAFEAVLATFAAISNFAQKAKELKVSVKISNAVDTSDPKRAMSLLAERTWLDLFSEKSRCQLDGPINAPDLLFTIINKDGKLTVKVDSEFLKKEEPSSEVGKAFKEFIEEANETLDEAFHRDRSLDLDDNLGSMNNTKQVHELTDFFEDKLRKIFFSVLVNKFVAETNKQ